MCLKYSCCEFVTISHVHPQIDMIEYEYILIVVRFHTQNVYFTFEWLNLTTFRSAKDQ